MAKRERRPGAGNDAPGGVKIGPPGFALSSRADRDRLLAFD